MLFSDILLAGLTHCTLGFRNSLKLVLSLFCIQ